MLIKDFIRIEKVKKVLEKIAYASLALDVSIAVVTLASLNFYKNELSKILLLLNFALSGEVVIVIVLAITVFYLTHYDKIEQNLIKFNLMDRKRARRKAAYYKSFL